jgi:hypothetical protein
VKFVPIRVIEYEDGSTPIEFQNMTKYEAVMFCYDCNSRINSFSTSWFYSFREQQRDVPVNMRIKIKLTNQLRIELNETDYIHLMDAILWVLGPYTDEPNLFDHPHMAKLAEFYNELHAKLPYDRALIYPELLFYT